MLIYRGANVRERYVLDDVAISRVAMTVRFSRNVSMDTGTLTGDQFVQQKLGLVTWLSDGAHSDLSKFKLV